MVLLSCSSTQKPDNTKPMYGEVPKSEQYKQVDEDFKKQCIEYYGTIHNAVQAHIEFGWDYFLNNDVTTAMKRFNQAWLLDAEYPDSYFGFAALMEVQGNKIEAERFYKIGNEKDTTKERAIICYQRIAECKDKLKSQ